MNEVKNEVKDERNGFERFRDAFLDTAASSSPVLSGLRGVVETKGWKEEQQKKQDEKEFRDLQMQKMRDAQRIRQDSEDQLAEQKGIKGLQEKMTEQFNGSPGWLRLGVEGQKAFFGDPAVKQLLKAQYLGGHVFEMAKGNQNSYGILDRELKRNNVKLVDGEKGIKYLEFPNGLRVAATKDEMDKINKNLSERAAKAMISHAQIAERFSETDPLLRSYLNYGSEFMKFHNGSAYSALQKSNSILEGATEAERSWHMCNMGIKALSNQGLSTAVKIEGLAQCIPAMKQLGYDVEGFDPKKPSLENVVILDPKNNRKLSLGEFAEIASDNDNLKRTYDKELGLAEEAAVAKKNQEAMNVMMYNASKAAAQQKLAGGKKSGVSESDEAGGTGDEREADAKADSMQMVKSGMDFANKYKIDIKRLFRNTKNNKNVKSVNDLYAFLSAAKDAAEETFIETGNYEDAQRNFVRTWKSFELPDDPSLNVWGDLAIHQDQERIKAEYKELNEKFPNQKSKIVNKGRTYTSVSDQGRNRSRREELANRYHENLMRLKKNQKESPAQQERNKRKKMFISGGF